MRPEILLLFLCLVCSWAQISPYVDSEVDEQHPSELMGRIKQECSGTLNDNMMYHCITKERKLFAIKKELQSVLVDRTTDRVNFSKIPKQQLESMLRKEGFAADGSYESDMDSQHGSTRMIPAERYPIGLERVKQRSFFNMIQVPHSEIREATINFFVRGIRVHKNYVKYIISGYRFRKNGEVDVDPIVTIKRKRRMGLDGDWDSLVVTDLAKEWASEPESNFGIMLKIEAEGTNDEDDFDPVDREDSPNAMFLEVKMAEDLKRVRRSATSPIARGPNLTCEFPSSHPEASCCRYHLEVDFEDFGWDWIIAPKRYNAYYCAGKCRHGQHQKHSQHAYFMEQKNRQNMCCSPERLTEMKIIYMNDEGNLQIRMIDNMIVQKCGCS